MNDVRPQDYAATLRLLLKETPDEKQLKSAVDRMVEELDAKGRRSWLPKILSEFEFLIEKDSGQIRVDVKTAKPLTEADRKQIAKSVGTTTGKLIIDEQFDPSLHAGWSIRVGDRLVQGTVQDRVQSLFATS